MLWLVWLAVDKISGLSSCQIPYPSISQGGWWRRYLYLRRPVRTQTLPASTYKVTCTGSGCRSTPTLGRRVLYPAGWDRGSPGLPISWLPAMVFWLEDLVFTLNGANLVTSHPYRQRDLLPHELMAPPLLAPANVERRRSNRCFIKPFHTALSFGRSIYNSHSQQHTLSPTIDRKAKLFHTCLLISQRLQEEGSVSSTFMFRYHGVRGETQSGCWEILMRGCLKSSMTGHHSRRMRG